MTNSSAQWDKETDIVVVGSGGGGMTAAILAKDRGANTLLIEKCSTYGGSSAMSGGSIWIPNNHLAAQANINDSYEEGLEYLHEITSGKVDDALLQTYVKKAPEMLMYLDDHAITRFSVTKEYPDYYPSAKGAKTNGGRSLEPQPFNIRKLGKTAKDLRMPAPHCIVLGRWMLTVNEVRDLMNSSLKARIGLLACFLGYALNPLRSFARRDTRLTLGNALIASLRKAMIERDIPLWLNTRLTRLVTNDNSVTGVEVIHQGETVRIHARKGVIIAAGGFDKNAAMRKQYQVSEDCAKWSSGNPDNTGEAIQAGMEIGASISNMSEAWWMPTTMAPGHQLPWYLKGSWWTDLAREQKQDFPWFILTDRTEQYLAQSSLTRTASGLRTNLPPTWM